MGRGPRAFIQSGLPDYEEMDDKYLNPMSQVKRIPQRFFAFSSPFVKDYKETENKMTPDEKIELILQTVVSMKTDFNNMLMLIMLLVFIILAKIIKR